MERIRVDTDELKAKAKVFETSANVYSKAGDEILSLVAGLPSYDGQLSGPARATALEINRQCKEIQAAYKSDAESLLSIAISFEDVDNQTIAVCTSFSSYLSHLDYSQLALPQSGHSVDSDGMPGIFGWTDDGKTITLYYFGKVIKLDKDKLTPSQMDDFEAFKGDVSKLFGSLEALAIALGVDVSALGILIFTALEAIVNSPPDIVPVLGQVKIIAEIGIIVYSALGVAITSVDALYQLDQIVGAFISAKGHFDDLSNIPADIP